VKRDYGKPRNRWIIKIYIILIERLCCAFNKGKGVVRVGTSGKLRLPSEDGNLSITIFNIQKLFIRPKMHYMFCVDLIINSDFFLNAKITYRFL